jgi:hypothetical protein
MRFRIALAVLAVAGVTTGCQDRTDVTRDGAAVEPADTPAAPVGDVMMVQLQEVGGSGISGDAAANHMADSVRVGLSLTGLQAGQSYPAHIHAGSCEGGGPVRVALQAITAGEDGMGTSSTTVAADQLGTDEPSFIQVHHPDGRPAACGNMEGHGR